MTIPIGRENNFDIVRLFAALQVVVFHAIKHYEISFSSTWTNTLIDALKLFPGVPVFFMISGFLVYQSGERNTGKPKKYFMNRFLRLFPGLWAMVIIMAIVILIEAAITGYSIQLKNFVTWFFCEFSFLQFYTPDNLRFWGVGAPNGSLWTISTEIQFYLLVPLLVYIAGRSKKLIAALFVIFIFVHLQMNRYDGENGSIIFKLLSFSIINYLYYFLMGTLLYLYRNQLINLWSGKWLWWLILYLAYNYMLNRYVSCHILQVAGAVVGHILLSFAVLSFVFSMRHLSESVLKENDISYGIYIYHMIVVNVFVQHGLIHRLDIFFLTIVIVILLAYLSWRFVEKPALKLKNRNVIPADFLRKFRVTSRE